MYIYDQAFACLTQINTVTILNDLKHNQQYHSSSPNSPDNPDIFSIWTRALELPMGITLITLITPNIILMITPDNP